MGHKGGLARCSADFVALGGSLERSRAQYARQCAAYRHVKFSEVLPDLARDSAESWSYERYLAAAMGHRFCLVAPGDLAGTPKITEMVAIGGAGGCIPVLLLPVARPAAEMVKVLPYGQWLDYCELAFFAASSVVSDAAARTELLRQLEGISYSEAAAKHDALRRARDAFVSRENSSIEEPTAPEYLAGEMCELSRRYLAAQAANRTSRVGLRAATDFTRCTLPRKIRKD